MITDNKPKKRTITKKQKEMIAEILEKYGYQALGFGEIDENVVVGASPTYHKEISKELSRIIKVETGIDTIINL